MYSYGQVVDLVYMVWSRSTLIILFDTPALYVFERYKRHVKKTLDFVEIFISYKYFLFIYVYGGVVFLVSPLI